MAETDWISAAEAARRLGIKQATLYSYVSRGVLTRRRASGTGGPAARAADPAAGAAAGAAARATAACSIPARSRSWPGGGGPAGRRAWPGWSSSRA